MLWTIFKLVCDLSGLPSPSGEDLVGSMDTSGYYPVCLLSIHFPKSHVHICNKKLPLPKVCTKMLTEAIKLSWLNQINIYVFWNMMFYDIICEVFQSKPNVEIPDIILVIYTSFRKNSTHWSKKWKHIGWICGIEISNCFHTLERHRKSTDKHF